MCGWRQQAQLAQLVEQRTENPRVSGSIPELGSCGCGSMVEHQPSKLKTWVRFPSPALVKLHIRECSQIANGYATVAQLVEHLLAKEEVAGSSPVCRSKEKRYPWGYLFCVI